ncbi:hypothetical protein [Dactylosporangium sp. CA-233914]|uniref:hypothetical protein n=1 Tax=Dactylosporangium sp. CA-233914 TaxID=3239934 RepID=UPI003D8D1A94
MSNPPLGYFESLINFRDRRFTFDADCVGAEVRFSYKGQYFLICFPYFDFSDRGGFGHPKPTFQGTRLTMKWLIRESDRDSFGRANSWNDNSQEVRNFTCNQFVVRSRGRMTAAEARVAKKHLVSWRESFAKWFEVLEYEDLTNDGSKVRQAESLESFFIPADKSKTERRIKSVIERQPVAITVVLTDGVPRASLKRVLRLSASGLYPPGYYAQLISALKYFNREEYRQSILDSATAFETSLIKLLDDRLATAAAGQRKLIEDKYGQIVNLSIALRALGEALPPQNDIQTKIAQPRNRAIHQGVEPSESQAKDALLFAKSFIYSKFPLR